MWLLHMEQTDGCQIMHGRNGREYRLTELPKFSVDWCCPETKVVYEFSISYYHVHMCQQFRDFKTMSGTTLAERYDSTMSRIEQITRAGYKVKVQF